MRRPSGAGAAAAWSARVTLLAYVGFLAAFFAAPLGVLAIRSFTDADGALSVANYRLYFASPALFAALRNTLILGAATIGVTLPLAFAFAYGLERCRFAGRGLLAIAGGAPLLAPSLLPAMALVYVFGRQGLAGHLPGGASIYGFPGLLLAETIAAFPHALVILRTALSANDGRLYEQARLLGISRWRTFINVTLPGARHGLISAAFVVFSLSIADVGAPKVVGGGFDVLALDIYKQVLGLQNFNLGAVVAMLLLAPTLVAVVFERWAARRQAALRSSRSTPYAPDVNRPRDLMMWAVCVLIGLALVGMLVVCQFAALARLWPYDLTLTLDHYRFGDFDGGGWEAAANSTRLALATAVIGSALIFGGAYASERLASLPMARRAYAMLALAPAAAPGLALGLAYALFFNDPANPLHGIYGTFWVLLAANIIHFFTVPHLTSVSAIRALDPEYESAARMSGRSVLAVFGAVVAPLSAASLADIALYLFANAMTTVSVVVFLYPPDFKLAAVAVLNMDDAGDAAPAAAMGMVIVYISLVARLAGAAAMRWLRPDGRPIPLPAEVAAV